MSLLSGCLVLQLVLVLGVNAEFFSSTSGLQQLLHTEMVLLEELENYVQDMTQHIDTLQREIDAIKVEHQSAGDGIEGYLNNPVNAFRLIKRLHSDWQAFSASVERDTSRKNYLEALTKQRQNLSYPSQEDFVGTALALTRLQQTYQLDVAELASGMLNGVKYGTAMSWQDCFVLGQHLYQLREYNHTVPWLQQSMQLLAQQSYAAQPAALEFMEDVLAYHQEMGDHENALQLVNYILAVEPQQRPHLYETKTLLEQLITDGVKRGLLHETLRSAEDYHSSNEFRLYEQVCREDLTPKSGSQRQLRCRYHSNNVGFRLLQPYKLEELHLKPYVVQYHDVMGATEMQILKKLAQPRIQRSLVYAEDSSEATGASYRTSQSASFEYYEHAIMQKLSVHMQDLTGLDMNYSEVLQIANYGVGGHYEPHLDSFPDDHIYDAGDRNGNRIATGIFYLSEVQAGGGTAFPYLPLLVTPESGSLLFWYNLHRSGDQDHRTRHAACPVLQGSKWIANVWIRMRNQYHVRPCDLQRDHEISQRFANFN